jgi:8-hydroxy-5-deazaflavin:NADPH oxidoreductase
MRIAIIGTGRVGSTLAKRWLAQGHTIVFGTREPRSEKVLAMLVSLGATASATGVSEAAVDADAVLLAVPWEGAIESVRSLNLREGQVLIDATNPLTMTPAGLQEGLIVGHTTSAAEQIANNTKARVVKAFNQSGTDVMGNESVTAADHTLFICGDDATAKQTVTALAHDLNYRVIDAGTLRLARLLEPLGMLWIHLCYLGGLGSNFCFKATELRSATPVKA